MGGTTNFSAIDMTEELNKLVDKYKNQMSHSEMVGILMTTAIVQLSAWTDRPAEPEKKPELKCPLPISVPSIGGVKSLACTGERNGLCRSQEAHDKCEYVKDATKALKDLYGK